MTTREKQKKCTHRVLELCTEKDRCTWVMCMMCNKTGPKKHSQTMALLAWVLHLANQHPRRRG